MFNEIELNNISPKVHSFYTWIRQNIPDGSTILEFGSGQTSNQLGEYYKMYSVENNRSWIGKYSTVTYINAPIVNYINNDPFLQEFPMPNNGWYDIGAIKKGIPKKYNLIIVDGPPGSNEQNAGRGGFYKYLDEFDITVPMIFHDVNRQVELMLVKKIAEKLNRKYEIISGQVPSAVIKS